MMKFLKGIIGLVIVVLAVVLVWNWWSGREEESKPLEDMVGNFTDDMDLELPFGNKGDGNRISWDQIKGLIGEVDVQQAIDAISSGDKNALADLKEQLGDVSLDKLADMGVYNIDEQSVFDSTREIYTSQLPKTDLGAGIASLQANVGGCMLKLVESEDENFYIQAEEYGKLQYFVENGILHLTSSKSGGSIESVTDGEILLYVPAGAVFQNVELELGAGAVTGVILEAQSMTLNIGMGSFEVDTLKANHLETNLSMGQMKATVDVVDSMKLSNAMGNMELTLQGKETDYNYKISGAMGKIMLNNQAYEGAVSSDDINNNATKNVDLECSIGNAAIKFTE